MIINEAICLGYSLFDTAKKYSNEKELGALLHEKDTVLVQTKVHPGQILGRRRYLWLNRKSVRSSFFLSSKTMQRNPDVFFIHCPFVGYERHFNKMVFMREVGEVKAIGVCNVDLNQLKKLISEVGSKPDIIQVEIHPYHTNRDLIEYCRDQEILVEARSPFAHGDAMQDWMDDERLKQIAKQYGKSVPQIILRWITQQNVIPIVRTTNYGHLQDNISIFDFCLTDVENLYIFSLNKDLSFGCISSKH